MTKQELIKELEAHIANGTDYHRQPKTLFSPDFYKGCKFAFQIEKNFLEGFLVALRTME